MDENSGDPGENKIAAVFSKVWATLAVHARSTTQATGAIIVLRESQQFVCSASVGSAPPVGTVLRKRGALFSECLETKRLLLCNQDAGSKLQDIPSKQRIPCASAALIPFELEGEVEGLLAVFSPFPSAFHQSAVERLSAIALVIESILFSATFLKNRSLFGTAAAVDTGQNSPQQSVDLAERFLNEIRSALPPIRSSGGETESSIESILRNVRSELDLSPKGSSQTQGLSSLALADLLGSVPAEATSGQVPPVTFEDQAGQEELPATIDFPDVTSPSTVVSQIESPLEQENTDAGFAPVTESLREISLVPAVENTIATAIVALAPETIALPVDNSEELPAPLAAAQQAESVPEDSQSAIEQLLQQAAPQIDNVVADKYLSQIEAVFSQTHASAPPLPPAEVSPPLVFLPEIETIDPKPVEPARRLVRSSSLPLSPRLAVSVAAAVLALLSALLWFTTHPSKPEAPPQVPTETSINTSPVRQTAPRAAPPASPQEAKKPADGSGQVARAAEKETVQTRADSSAEVQQPQQPEAVAVVPTQASPKPETTENVAPPPVVASQAPVAAPALPSVGAPKPVLSPRIELTTMMLTPARNTEGLTPIKMPTTILPPYPEEARTARIQGSVVLRVVISSTGRVDRITVVDGDRVLSTAAINTVQDWVSEPARIDGKAVDSTVVVTLNFHL